MFELRPVERLNGLHAPSIYRLAGHAALRRLRRHCFGDAAQVAGCGASVALTRRMIRNVSADQHIPRIAMAIAAGVGASFAPSAWAKTGLFATAAGLLASVASGYCPITAALDSRGDNQDEPHWRTLKTYRVEA